MNDYLVEIEGEEIILSPYKACYWKKKSTLILSDLHLGKAGHFRKHGIPISRKVHLADIQILERLILQFNPERVLLLGDLFHSDENLEWQDFVLFLDHYQNVEFVLVQGNHDILEEYPPKLKVVQKIEENPFSFTHIKEDCPWYNISGHIHPGIRINGKARQGVTIPCFWFSNDYAIIPAFGQFTGIKKIKPAKADRIFAIAEDSVIALR